MKYFGDARSFASGFIAALAVVAGAAITTHPAFASAALGAIECSAAKTACFTGTNTSSGPGAEGVSSSGSGLSGKSAKGYGVHGHSTSDAGVKGSSYSSYGVEATSDTNYGLRASTTSGPAGIIGTSSTSGGFGVYGYTAASPYGYALFGNAPNGGFGVYGESGASGSAVVGDAQGSGTGTTGVSSSGNGAEGVSSDGTGVMGSSNASYGVTGTTTSGLAGVMGQAPGLAQYGLYGFNSANVQGVGGIGVIGVAAKQGVGVYGMTASGEGVGVSGYASDAGTGMYGSSVIGNGVNGVSATGYGVLATSNGSTGMYASSSTGDAIDATTTNGFGLLASSYYLAGVEASSQEAAGVYATSNSGIGVYASSYQKTGLEAISTDGNGLEAFSTIGAAIIGQTFGSAPAIQGYSVSGGYSFAGYDYSTGNNTFFVDDAGNIGYSGNINSFSRVRGGATVKTFAPKMSTPTVEDQGTAQLVAGESIVRFDSVFAASMDPNTTYQVLITPGGDTNGLYVAQKTGAGFVVRESKGGRSTTSFDYRIVATAMGHAGQRMSIATIASAVPRNLPLGEKHVASIPALPRKPKFASKPRVPQLQIPTPPHVTVPKRPTAPNMAQAAVR